MDYNEVLDRARMIMGPNCRVCKECNGIACRGEIPGTGGKGAGRAFTGCLEYLAKVKIKMDVIYENKGQDTTIELFGSNFSLPVFAAPIAGMKLNYNGYLTDKQYTEAVVSGTLNAGSLAFTGDGPSDEMFLDSLSVIETVKGIGIPTLKPWKNDKVLEKLQLVEKANAIAFAMDIDSAGLVNLANAGKPVSAKSVAELSEIAHATKIPFLIKGIMTPEGAEKAVQTGAYGIVVSNHGGRVLADAEPTCKVLPGIKKAVGKDIKIFVDGGIRSGSDVFKALALGADAVLIGRPITIAAHGGGADGVKLYIEKIAAELREAMIMTGCPSLHEITMDKITAPKESTLM